ncbi:unnamed protein product, partial [Rotaria sp. Silwood1]
MSTDFVSESDQHVDNVSTRRESKIHHQHQHENVHYGKRRFAVGLAAFTSLGGWFFGYDQGVTG